MIETEARNGLVEAVILDYLQKWDHLPSPWNLADELRESTGQSLPRGRGRPSSEKSIEKIGRKLYQPYMDAGLVTEVGEFSGRPHLTEEGREFFAELLKVASNS